MAPRAQIDGLLRVLSRKLFESIHGVFLFRKHLFGVSKLSIPPTRWPHILIFGATSLSPLGRFVAVGWPGDRGNLLTLVRAPKAPEC
ncbi:hypothetical protein N7471_011362 [Penicillium samsonianum]|uniref:uncharacterized protein n=1 Tax=Penicillium samsonianum TaxID=1882272 RepID=UPI0025467E5C|nr:uncharacterized protein N7471_011362 [Penicillium samsonianum]KAJ6124045.1 hypothetical protein N7471_011362 [Penicillium samsonianum]